MDLRNLAHQGIRVDRGRARLQPPRKHVCGLVQHLGIKLRLAADIHSLAQFLNRKCDRLRVDGGVSTNRF